MHRDLKASRRYAKSILDLAIEQNKLEEVTKDMTLLREAFNSNEDLVKFLHSPLIKVDKKQAVMGKIFKGKVSPMTMEFLRITTSKRRENILPGIARAFQEQLRAHNGVSLAEITTAVALDNPLREKLKKLVLTMYDKVELKEVVDPDIIGGFSIQVGDDLYDETISSRISALKRHYWNNPYISKF